MRNPARVAPCPGKKFKLHLELSKAKWMLGVALPGAKKLSRYTITGGDVAAPAARLAEWRRKAAFLAAQFQLQHAHYWKYYPEADWLVTMRDGEDTGRLYLERWPSQHRLIDITLLPEHRGKGFGEALLRDLMDEAAAVNKAVSIHVEKFNPAMRLYRRLGFTVEEDKGVYDLMRWTPS
jgi:GNAT superfamily N-acetyltransferase